MNNEGIACVECGGETELIKIVDATQPGMALGATDAKSAASHHILREPRAVHRCATILMEDDRRVL